jgi:uncharacterized protein YbjT (DUF2867 family)
MRKEAGTVLGLEVLVLGATGRFSSLTERLLERGHRVRAATRSPDSAEAGVLRRLGAGVVRVDFDDVDSIEAATRGVDAVFAAGTAHAAGPSGDVVHGRAIIDAAVAAGAGRLVYVSVAGADSATEVPLFESKRRVERYLRGSSLPFTIVAPVYLMENLWNPWNRPVLEAGRLPSPLPPDRMLQQIPIADVVSFVCHVLERPSDFRGERIEIASDELTALDAAAIVGGLVGRPLSVEKTSAGPIPMFLWLDRVGYTVNIAELRARLPDVGWHRYSEWAETQDWSPLATASVGAQEAEVDTFATPADDQAEHDQQKPVKQRHQRDRKV